MLLLSYLYESVYLTLNDEGVDPYCFRGISVQAQVLQSAHLPLPTAGSVPTFRPLKFEMKASFNWSSFTSTFEASVRSVGTAVTLAAVGVYLHRRKFVSSEGKRTLAKISQQVTFPLFLFTKIIYCNQVRVFSPLLLDWSDLTTLY